MWVKTQWYSFEAWLASKAPGWKTKLVAIVGFFSTGAIAVQNYFQGLDLTSLVELKTIAIINMVLFTLSFWLRDISQRVEARKERIANA